MLDAVSESDPRRRTQRSSSRLRTPLPPSLSPSASVDSDRSPLSSLFSSLPLWREGGMAHASTSAAAAAYAPSITNVNSQDGSLSHWLRRRRRRRRCSIALSLLVERGREGSEEVAPVAVVPSNGDSRIDREGARPRRGLPRSPLPSSSSLPSLLPPLACSLLPPPPPSSERSLSSRPFFSSHAEKGRSKE